MPQRFKRSTFQRSNAGYRTTLEAPPLRSRNASKWSGNPSSTAARSGHSRQATASDSRRSAEKAPEMAASPSSQDSNGGSAQARSKVSPRCASAATAAAAGCTRVRALFVLEVEEGAVVAEDAGRATVSFDKHHRGRAARQGLEPYRASAGKKVEKPGTRDQFTENRKDALAHGVWGRPDGHVLGRAAQTPRAPDAARDPHFTGPTTRRITSSRASSPTISRM